MHKKLRLFTAVWGEKHIDWFARACLNSLRWQQNHDAIKGSTWNIVTRAQDKEKIEALIKEYGIQITDLDFSIFNDEFEKNPHAAGAYMLQAYLMEMSKCITFGAQSLTCPPDTIFGNGSIANMREIGRSRDSVVFAVHARVTPKILEQPPGWCTSNAGLVTLAFEHLHKTWEQAQDGLAQINSYVGGVSWRYLEEGLYSVTHRLPTPYLCNFTPEDLVFFKNQIHYGVLDHAWPAACLIETERMRVVGSSDIAFMVEVTPENENIPPVAPYHEDEPDLFWRNLAHNKINRMYSVALRGENCK